MTVATHGEWERLTHAVDVWFIEPQAVAVDVLRQCEPWLSDREQEHRLRLRIEAVRHAYTVTRVLCRGTLSRYTGVDQRQWRFASNAHGKPAIVEPHDFTSLRFNLTHTDGLIACAVTRAGELGVDAESLNRSAAVEEIARYFLSKEERLALDGVTSDRRAEWLVEAWVLKEAYLKGRGVGISSAPDAVTIDRDASHQAIAPAGWHLALHRPTVDHIAAVALQLDGPHDDFEVPTSWRRAEWFTTTSSHAAAADGQ